MNNYVRKISKHKEHFSLVTLLIVSATFSPFINFISANINEPLLNYSYPFAFTAVSAIIIITAVLILQKILNKKVSLVDLAILTTIPYILFNHYELILKLSNKLGFIYSHLTSGILILSIFFLFIVLIKFEKIKKMYVIISITILILSIANFFFLYLNNLFNDGNDTNAAIIKNANYTYANQINSTEEKINNIYYIIADGMGSSNGLKYADVSTNNTNKITNLLNKRGFYTPKNSTSSYNLTLLTLQSIFDMDYISNNSNYLKYKLKGTFPSLIIPMASLSPRITTLELELLKSGYKKFLWFGNSLIKCDKRSRLQCYETNSNSFFNNFLLKVINNNSLMAYIENSIYPRLIHKLLKKLSYKKNDAIGDLTEYLSNNNPKKSFLFIHQMMPHPPYVDKDCNYTEGSKPKDWHESDKDKYNNSILCLNKKIRRLLSLIEKKDKNAIVVIQGDHGSRFNFPNNTTTAFRHVPSSHINETHLIFNALKLPKHCSRYLYDKIGTVNSTRLAISCATGTIPKLTNDRSFFSVNAKSESLKEVTNILNLHAIK